MRIPLSTFEQVIDETILKRGLDYFKTGAVDLVEELEPGLFEASVRGTEHYSVRLRIKGGAITEHQCDCPYDLGPVCKHVVAVIFHMKKEELDLKVRKTKGTTPSLKHKTVADQVSAILGKLDRAELSRFMERQCAEDRAFRNLFLAEFAHHGDGNTKAAYVKQLKSVLTGTDHWRMARPLSSAAARLLERAWKHAEDGQFTTALMIAGAIAETLVRAFDHVDDSHAHMSTVVNDTFDLTRSLCVANEAMRKEVVDYCFTAYEKKLFEGWDWHTTALEIAIDHVKGAAEIKRAHAALDADDGSDFGREQAARLTMSLLRRTEGEAAAETYMMRHLDIASFRSEIIRKAISRHDLALANRLTEEAIASDLARDRSRPMGSTAHSVSRWTDQLLEIAIAAKDTDKIIAHARMLFLHGFNADREKLLRLLNEHVPSKEWRTFADTLIQEIKTRTRFPSIDHIASVLAHDERWGDLACELRPYPYASTIEQYEQCLAKEHAPEVADLYAATIRQDLGHAHSQGRKAYQKAARCIRRMIKIGQREKAETLITELREKYPQRTALMEELQRI